MRIPQLSNEVKVAEAETESVKRKTPDLLRLFYMKRITLNLYKPGHVCLYTIGINYSILCTTRNIETFYRCDIKKLK